MNLSTYKPQWTFVLITFLFIIILKDLHLIYGDLEEFLRSWNATEIFISYHGGFVRRGLLGSFIFEVSNFLNIDVFVFSTTILLMVAVIVLLKLSDILSRYDKFLPILLLSVIFFGSYLNNYQWFRKDLLIILLFLGYLDETQLKWMNVLKPLMPFLALFIHELSFFIFILPVILQYDKNNLVKTFYSIAYLTLTSLLFTIYHGNEIIANRIWVNYLTNFSDFNISQSPVGAIEAIGFDSKQGIDWSMNILSRPLDFIALISLTILVVYLIGWLISILLESREYLGKHFGYAVIYFIPFSITYLLGWDYNRWISIYSLSAICFFSNEKLVSMLIFQLERINIRIPGLDNVKLNFLFGIELKSYMYLLLFLIIPYPQFSGGNYLNQFSHKILKFVLLLIDLT